MNYNFLCHIIRDIFNRKSNILIYGDITESLALRSIMLSNEHSMGSFILHTDRNHEEYFEETAYWEMGINGPYVGYNYSDLFISLNYNPELLNSNYDFIAEQIKCLLKHNGHAVIVNPGNWASNLTSYLYLNKELTKEAQKYSMLSKEKVFIYENI